MTRCRAARGLPDSTGECEGVTLHDLRRDWVRIAQELRDEGLDGAVFKPNHLLARKLPTHIPARRMAMSPSPNAESKSL